jgi:predicted molibdopterin-dependent oxidoreductase YjgC
MSKKIHLQIDGRDVEAEEGMTVLEAARGAGIKIPTICFHPELEPWGGCRLCIVELDFGDWTRLVVSCVYLAADGLVVRTRSPKVDKIRKGILELLLAHAPHSPQLVALATEYGADRNRFEQDGSFCIHCGLCVRYCAEIAQKHAVGFIDRGTRKEISFIPEIAATACNDCKGCFPLCPTSYVQAAFARVEALVFPRDGKSWGPPPDQGPERGGGNTRPAPAGLRNLDPGEAKHDPGIWESPPDQAPEGGGNSPTIAEC